LQALDESVIGIGRKKGVGFHTAIEVWYPRLPCFICR